jgi:DNA mismatch repair protein MutS
LAAGGSTHSFGIHVAKMAGMPNTLIARANEILQQLESSRDVQENKKGNTPTAQDTSVLKELKIQQKLQLNIFDVHSQTFDEIRNALVDLDINRLTPVEALLKLQEIKGMVKE